MSKKNKGGRPTIMTPIIIGKLEQVFSLDGTVKEACLFAGINPDTYYEYLKKNPSFADRVEALRETPVLLARQTVVGNIKNSYSNAIDYLSRKRKGEFSTRTEYTGADGIPLAPTITEEEKTKLLKLIKRK